MLFEHYYVMTEPRNSKHKHTNGKTITSLYEDAPDEVIKAVETPCAWENPPRNCVNYPPPDKDIPIIRNPVMSNDELRAEIIPRNPSNLESRRKMVLGTNNNDDVLQYNKDWRTARFAERQGDVRQGDVYGGAKNKKKHRFRTKRRRSASRRSASRRNASRRNASRRRTSKK